MKKVIQLTEWQSASGAWYCADTTNFTKWWYIPRKLKMSFEDYIQLLLDYGAQKITYCGETDVLIFSWSSQTKMRKYKNDINRRLRQAS